MIEHVCPNCGGHIVSDDSRATYIDECPVCKSDVLVPECAPQSPADQIQEAMRARYMAPDGGAAGADPSTRRGCANSGIRCPYCQGRMEQAKTAMHPIILVCVCLMILLGFGVSLTAAIHGWVRLVEGIGWSGAWICMLFVGRKSIWRCGSCRSILPRG
jgi:ribosomal protein L37AE/L43A